VKIYRKVVIDIETGERLSEESYSYSGVVEKCCGPSHAEQNDSANTEQLSQQLSQAFNQNFASQSGVLSKLNSVLSPIASAGPSQQGFSPAELAARNTASINATAGANRMAQQAAGNFAAGEGGGSSSGLTSGVTRQIQGTIASSQASNLANQENQTQIQNYETGRDNFNRSITGLGTLAGLYSPDSYGNSAAGADSSAFEQADKISSEKNQETAEIAGAITGGVMDAATFGAGALGGGGFDLGGGLQALTGKG
jgi:hypothetical protein